MDISATEDERAMGRGYEELFVPALFAPWTIHLVDGAGIARGQRVLDIACGTGVLSRHAARLTGAEGHVTGLDPSAGMLATAQEVAPEIDWRQGTAEAMDFPDASFDAVMSQFGMMFFADKPGAVAEMRRVLKPGGRLAVAVFDVVANNPAYATIHDLLGAEVGPEALNAVSLPYSLGDAGDFRGYFEEGGFTDIRCDTRGEEITFPGPRVMVEADLRGWLPLFGIVLSEEKIADLLDKAEVRLARYTRPSGQTVFPASAHILTARRPG